MMDPYGGDDAQEWGGEVQEWGDEVGPLPL